jgi:hypothetical protein
MVEFIVPPCNGALSLIREKPRAGEDKSPLVGLLQDEVVP